jgi:hypothetical protein
MDRLHVATLNILNLADRWFERLPLLLADMAALQPDLLGLQEVVYPMHQDRLLGAAGLLALFMVLVRRSSAAATTWGCGYAQPTQRMQYTGRSFAEMFAEHLLIRFLRPRTSRKAPDGLFPAPSAFASHNPDPFTEKMYKPLVARWARRFTHLRVLQQGHLHLYLMYILFTVVLALAWMSLRTWWRASG